MGTFWFSSKYQPHGDICLQLTLGLCPFLCALQGFFFFLVTLSVWWILMLGFSAFAEPSVSVFDDLIQELNLKHVVGLKKLIDVSSLRLKLCVVAAEICVVYILSDIHFYVKPLCFGVNIKISEGKHSFS